MLRRVIGDARPTARLPWMVIYHYNLSVNHEPTMRKTNSSRGPRSASMARLAARERMELLRLLAKLTDRRE